jgi:TrmH family RNA methyltransferase
MLLADLARQGCALHAAPDEAVAGLMGGRGGGAIVGLVPLPTPPPPAILAGRPDALILAAVDVEDPGNVGALARTALASGAVAFAATGVSDPFHPKAVRTSMGAIFKLPVLRYAATTELLVVLRAHGIRTLGAVSSGGVPLPELPPSTAATALLVGSEAFGLPAEVALSLDGRVTVPMSDAVDSFSVNAAAAILLYVLRNGR